MGLFGRKKKDRDKARPDGSTRRLGTSSSDPYRDSGAGFIPLVVSYDQDNGSRDSSDHSSGYSGNHDSGSSSGYSSDSGSSSSSDSGGGGGGGD
jgi:hypothetical protein